MRLLTILLCFRFAFVLSAAQPQAPIDKPPVAQQQGAAPAAALTTDTARSRSSESLNLTLLSSKYTNAIDLRVGPDDANIAQTIVRILMSNHYRQIPIDDDLASKFLDRYLDMLDPLHLLFFQSDVEEFDPYRTTIDDLIKKRGDTTPALVIFKRFTQRFAQQATYVNELLQTEKFDFTGSDRFLLNRRKAPRPKDLDQAKQLWRERLRYEYLQEKLNKEKPEEIVKIITRRYDRTWRTLREWESEDVFAFYLTALANVFDPHSDYMSKSQLDSFN